MRAGLLKQVKVFQNINPIKKYMKREHELMQEEESDRVVVISGYEGSGKSYFAMDYHETWYSEILGIKDVDEMHKTFCFKDVDWGRALVHCKKKPYRMITHDEAVNILYRKEGATKRNKEINKAFKKFRGKSWYHLMLIPQLHRMDKEMVEDRVRMLYFVFMYNNERYVAVYTKTRLDSLIAEISRMIESTAKDVKSRPQVLNCATNPAFICKIPKYSGKMLKGYAPNKQTNMDDSVDDVVDVLEGKAAAQYRKLEKIEIKKKALNDYKNKRGTQAELAAKYGIGERTLRAWVSEQKQSSKA